LDAGNPFFWALFGAVSLGRKSGRRSEMAKAKKSKSAGKKLKKAAPSKTGDVRIGDMLRKVRESAGISQEELASRLKTKRTAISRIENHADDIKFSTLERVAKALGKDLKVKIL
jgi:HTH-type transcriptional regulator / antitoxin HipB